MHSLILSQCRDLKMDVTRKFRSFNHSASMTVTNLLEANCLYNCYHQILMLPFSVCHYAIN